MCRWLRMDLERWAFLDMDRDVAMDRDDIMAEVGDLVDGDDFRRSDRLGIIPAATEEDFEEGQNPLAQHILFPKDLSADQQVTPVQHRRWQPVHHHDPPPLHLQEWHL